MTKRLYNIVNGEVLRQRLMEDNTPRTTLSFYQYMKITDVHGFRDRLYEALDEIGVLGRIYVAREGINGQISIPNEKMDCLRPVLIAMGIDPDLRLNYAIEDDGKSFFKLAIKERHKIVADGLNDETFDVTDRGTHLDAKSFNELTDREDTIIIDMRNHYESEVGHFENAVTPDVETFREALDIVPDMLEEHKDKHIVMYCTGGIRCEKASAYMKHKGFEKVYQLDGGIIEYARQAEAQGLKNKFLGKNFVFDERLGERIGDQIISRCHQCGEPCDDHINCANDACHLLFIQCSSCAEKYNQCCSDECKDFSALPEEEREILKKEKTFNGTRNNKGRFPKAETMS